MAAHARDVFWGALAWRGLEQFRIEEAPDRIVASGVLSGQQDGPDYALRYRVVCDAAWRTRDVALEIRAGRHTRSLALRADGAGRWVDGDGQAIAAVAGALDVDIAATPFTNTLPIRRLALRSGDTVAIRAAWVRVPSLAVEPLDQRYTCLAHDVDGARWRYESPGFTAEITTDGDGLVVGYEGLFERTWPLDATGGGPGLAVSTLIERDGNLLLLRRSAARDHAPGEWETGSGRVEAGEPPPAAAIREAKEETGLDVEVVMPLDTFRFLRGPARVPVLGMSFHCRVRGGTLRVSDEHDDARWVPLDRAVDESLPGLFRGSIERLLAIR